MKKIVQMVLVAGAVMAFATAAKAQVNLAVTEIRLVQTNDAYVVNARVENRSTISSPATGWISLYNRVNRPVCGTAGYLARQPMSYTLRGGAYRWVTFGPFSFRGLINLWCFVDSTCVIPESNEADNTYYLRMYTSPRIGD